MVKRIDPAQVRASVEELLPWIQAGEPTPSRAALAQAVRLSARLLAQDQPGQTVEVRVPPFVAVQCMEGPKHTRGTPPNVVETDARTWLRLVIGDLTVDQAQASTLIDASGSRATDIASALPLIRF